MPKAVRPNPWREKIDSHEVPLPVVPVFGSSKRAQGRGMAAESCKREETGLAAAEHRVQGLLDINFHRLGTPWIPDTAAVVIIYIAPRKAPQKAQVVLLKKHPAEAAVTWVVCQRWAH